MCFFFFNSQHDHTPHVSTTCVVVLGRDSACLFECLCVCLCVFVFVYGREIECESERVREREMYVCVCVCGALCGGCGL